MTHRRILGSFLLLAVLAGAARNLRAQPKSDTEHLKIDLTGTERVQLFLQLREVETKTDDERRRHRFIRTSLCIGGEGEWIHQWSATQGGREVFITGAGRWVAEKFEPLTDNGPRIFELSRESAVFVRGMLKAAKAPDATGDMILDLGDRFDAVLAGTWKPRTGAKALSDADYVDKTPSPIAKKK